MACLASIDLAARKAPPTNKVVFRGSQGHCLLPQRPGGRRKRRRPPAPPRRACPPAWWPPRRPPACRWTRSRSDPCRPCPLCSPDAHGAGRHRQTT
eukprot:scaffold42981_cov25-Prasinocladus_malaysianus.AAC.1